MAASHAPAQPRRDAQRIPDSLLSSVASPSAWKLEEESGGSSGDERSLRDARARRGRLRRGTASPARWNLPRAAPASPRTRALLLRGKEAILTRQQGVDETVHRVTQSVRRLSHVKDIEKRRLRHRVRELRGDLDSKIKKLKQDFLLQAERTAAALSVSIARSKQEYEARVESELKALLLGMEGNGATTDPPNTAAAHRPAARAAGSAARGGFPPPHTPLPQRTRASAAGGTPLATPSPAPAPRRSPSSPFPGVRSPSNPFSPAFSPLGPDGRPPISPPLATPPPAESATAGGAWLSSVPVTPAVNRPKGSAAGVAGRAGGGLVASLRLEHLKTPAAAIAQEQSSSAEALRRMTRPIEPEPPQGSPEYRDSRESVLVSPASYKAPSLGLSISPAGPKKRNSPVKLAVDDQRAIQDEIQARSQDIMRTFVFLSLCFHNPRALDSGH